MVAAVVIDDTLTIPGCDGLAGFRGWTRSPGFPSTGRIDWIAGRIEVDMSPENLLTHGTLKTEIAAKIYARVRLADLGEVFIDRTRLVCPTADLSVEPDVVFVSHAAVENGRTRFVPAAAAEIAGRPVSPSLGGTVRLTKTITQRGLPRYDLEIRDGS